MRAYTKTVMRSITILPIAHDRITPGQALMEPGQAEQPPVLQIWKKVGNSMARKFKTMDGNNAAAY